MIDFKQLIANAVYDESMGLEVDEIKSWIEIPADESMGDYAFPCFRLAKVLRKAPPLIAQEVAERASGSEGFARVENVNAYVNFFIDRAFLAGQVVDEVNSEGDSYGRSDVGKGRKVIVEYSSPNIAKPFHIGHIRSTVIGNALYKLYDAVGYDVTRINHLGDYGTQFGKMIVAYRKWGSEEELAKDPIKTLLAYYTKFHEEAKIHPELEDEARETFVRLEAGEPEETELWKKFRELSLAEFNRVYDMLDITFDSYAGESFYSDKMPRFIDELREKGLLVESQGAQIVDLEPYDMGAAMITKSDGSSLYVTRDIAAAVYRKEHYDFYKCIYVVASQQNLHFKQWKKVLELMGYEWEKDCIHVPFGLVSLSDGDDIKMMSTREGRVVFLEDVLNTAVQKTADIMRDKETQGVDVEEVSKEVGIGAVIFQELSNNRIKDYVFSWDKVLNFDGETGPYVQYTHARASSVLRKAAEAGVNIDDLGAIDPKYLESDSAYTLVKLIYRVPETVVEAADKYEPSILTRHLVDIAQAFNKFYHDEHILVDNEDEKLAKLALVKASKTVIANCLGLLGIKAPERM
ncbi:MAG: arginine--tRNA ligase [Clostridiales bacterium]|jgi:arginyl-tRNA synthetase|nr:arginine--tRNA ligase [Clostridiales bacterium]